MWCFLYKWLISHSLDADKPLLKIVEKHIKRCQSCREFHETSAAIAGQLVREVRASESFVPPLLHEKIMSTIHRQSSHASARRSVMRPAFVLAIVALLLTLAAGWYFLHFQSADFVPVASTGKADLSFRSDELLIEQIPEYETTLKELASQLEKLVSTPFASEFERLKIDIKTAMNFLAVCLGKDMKV